MASRLTRGASADDPPPTTRRSTREYRGRSIHWATRPTKRRGVTVTRTTRTPRERRAAARSEKACQRPVSTKSTTGMPGATDELVNDLRAIAFHLPRACVAASSVGLPVPHARVIKTTVPRIEVRLWTNPPRALTIVPWFSHVPTPEHSTVPPCTRSAAAISTPAMRSGDGRPRPRDGATHAEPASLPGPPGGSD